MPISTIQSGSFPSNIAIDTDTLVVDGANNRVGIGVSDPSQAIDLVGSSNSGSGSVRAGGTGSGTQAAFIAQAQFGSASFGTYASYPAVLNSLNNPMVYFNTNASGRAVFAEGITFNGDTAAANALDDYEEGNWTPQFGGSSTTGTGTYSTTVGRYVKVGKKVNCWGIIVSSGTHNGTGTLQIIGLPFNKENTYLSWGTETSIAYYFALTSFGTATNVLRLLGPVSNGSFLRFHSFQNNGDTSLPPTPANVQNGTSMYFSATYEVQ